MERAATSNDNDNKKQTEIHFNFAQEIIDLIVFYFDYFDDDDRVTLNRLCKISPSWKHAVLRKIYSNISSSSLDKVIERPYLANYVKVLDFSAIVSDSYNLKTIQFPNLNKMILRRHKFSDNVRQLLCQNTFFQDLYLHGFSNENALGLLDDTRKARIQASNYQPLLSYSGPLDEEISSCLQKLGCKSLTSHNINCEDILPSFSQFNDLQDIALIIFSYEEKNDNRLIEAFKYLSKFKSLLSFRFDIYASGNLSKNVSNALVENVLMVNAPTLQNVSLDTNASGLSNLLLDQHLPSLKYFRLSGPNICPRDLINFLEKAPNIQDINIVSIDDILCSEAGFDVPIKIINTLQKLSYMSLYVTDSDDEYDHYDASGAEIRYIQRQNVDEKLNGPKSKLFDLKRQYRISLLEPVNTHVNF